jgi:hypothetical protein
MAAAHARARGNISILRMEIGAAAIQWNGDRFMPVPLSYVG